ncbi:thioredoxin-like protein [Flagelloscypha sp. PMI_526]|nr:thioredoxin-like protein [Flagelloscypha sp. PMI_526]
MSFWSGPTIIWHLYHHPFLVLDFLSLVFWLFGQTCTTTDLHFIKHYIHIISFNLFYLHISFVVYRVLCCGIVRNHSRLVAPQLISNHHILLSLTFSSMYADIEALVLSGELFNNNERSSSPPRTPSPDAGWHDDELEDDEKQRQKNSRQPTGDDVHESVGMGPGRTGVKGVIRDRNEAEQMNRSKRNQEVEEMREKMEKTNLGGKTFLEEERLKGDHEKVDDLVQKERERDAASRNTDQWGRQREGRFGHLREVGVKGFVDAVEKEERGIWVVVHLYEPSLERCYALDDNLAKLARLYPDTKFLRARASILGFATSGSASLSTTATEANTRSGLRKSSDDDDDDIFDEKGYSDEDEDAFAEDDVDLDMLPTMLVYRDGELVHNWVRVDWEAGKLDIEELLDKHHILPQQLQASSRNLGLPEDDEDLIWSDEDSEP